MRAPPEKRKPARRRSRLATNEFQKLSSHEREVGASRIPALWLREGTRLFREAERSNLTRDWRATAIHFVGIVTRMKENSP